MLPVTEHVLGVQLSKVTGRPLSAVAVRVNVEPTASVAGTLKAIDSPARTGTGEFRCVVVPSPNCP